MSQYYRQQITS